MVKKQVNRHTLPLFLYSYSLIIVMKLTQKIRVNPSKEQEHLLWILSEKCRLLYNFALAERIENYQQNKRTSMEKRHYIT
ncbi:MAG: helix-turn-helix domain-containing protein, partial [Candidatus Lokiarchaeota archaeon]|nr:helix-turn-helix domain-containing protein [Candidatus Lokiarchaeota archaeon]